MTTIQGLSVEIDPRGESDEYEAFMLVQRNNFAIVVSYEGIRKDRTAMYPEIREWLEPILARWKADLAR